MTGGAGNDTLDGGGGNDTLIGGAGNDVYVVDVVGDVVTENLNEGTDEVRSSAAAYVLSANVENLTYIGTGDFTGTGNTLNNTLTGGAGNDVLDGGTGTDTMVGGAGNDVYFVDVAADVVTEGVGAGIDEIRTALTTFTLGQNVEFLTYTGTAAFTGTGNALNKASGARGRHADGGAGADAMFGGVVVTSISLIHW